MNSSAARCCVVPWPVEANEKLPRPRPGIAHALAERVHGLGGHFEIAPASPSGVSLRVGLPLRLALPLALPLNVEPA